MTRKLTKAAVAPLRNKLLKEQGGICPLCEEKIDVEKVEYDKNGKVKKSGGATLDHDHKTGKIRGVLCWFCNAFEGVVTKKRFMNGLGDDEKFKRYLKNLPDYLFKEQYDIFHPTHRTEDEKRTRRNTKAREAAKKRREALKEKQAQILLNKQKGDE